MEQTYYTSSEKGGEGLSYLQSMPAEVSVNYYSTLDYESLRSLCTTDKFLNDLCNDPEFWKSLIYKRFGKTDIPNNVSARSYYLLLINRYDVEISWFAPFSIDSRRNVKAEFTLDYNDINGNDAGITIDVFDVVVNLSFDRTIKITYNKNVYTLQTDFANNLRDIKGYLEGTMVEIDKLRNKLRLPSNIKIYIAVDPHFIDRSPILIENFNETQNKIKQEIISRGNYVIELYECFPSRATVVYNNPVVKIIEFYRNEEKLDKFLELLPSVRQEGEIWLYIPYVYNGKNVILVKEFTISFSSEYSNFTLERHCVRILNFNMEEYNTII